MKTKSRGGIVVKSLPGGIQDYTWSVAKKEWVKYGAYVPYVNTARNGIIESITYDDSKRTGTLKRTRKCLHTTVSIQNWSENHRYYLDSTGTKYREYRSGCYFDVSVLAIPNLHSVHSEALDFFRSGCVEKHFDLAADLVEWKQVSSLLPSLSSSVKSLKRNYLKYSFDLKKDPKRALKDLADLHLAYSFGIKPLVSDIVDLVKSVQALKEKVTWLRKNQGKPVKVSFSKDLSTVYRPSSSIADNGVARSQVHVNSYTCKYRAYALMVYNVEGLTDLELKLRILTRNFGLDKPLAWAWELTPWSFVLDWVLKVGDLIENLSPSIILPYHFLDVGYTVKIRESLGREVFFRYPFKGDNNHLYGTRTRTLFFREPGLPTSFSIATGTPGANQLALAISLAIQKWK